MMGSMAMIRMPTFREAAVSSSLERMNLVFSYPSRTKAFTTRMATRFSCTVLFRLSIFFCITSNRRLQIFISSTMAAAMTGMTASSTRESLGLMDAVTMRAATRVTGARVSIRRPMASIMVMALTSLVMRVMSEAEENRSMSAKENSCTWSNSPWRRFAPKPWLHTAENRAESTPKAMAARESASMAAPMRRI